MQSLYDWCIFLKEYGQTFWRYAGIGHRLALLFALANVALVVLAIVLSIMGIVNVGAVIIALALGLIPAFGCCFAFASNSIPFEAYWIERTPCHTCVHFDPVYGGMCRRKTTVSATDLVNGKTRSTMTIDERCESERSSLNDTSKCCIKGKFHEVKS